MTDFELTYTNLDWPFGKEFAIKGLPVLRNGEPTIVSQEQADRFKQLTGRTLREEFKSRGDFTIKNVVHKSDGGEN
jgi:hypothetical protein